ncbi:MAG TPA: hypothetical protein VGN26_09095 [Armatimonadota bacterium]|jgi:hypothetical protein
MTDRFGEGYQQMSAASGNSHSFAFGRTLSRCLALVPLAALLGCSPEVKGLSPASVGLPVYPGAIIQYGIPSSDSHLGTAFRYDVPRGDPETICRFYDARLAKSGWHPLPTGSAPRQAKGEAVREFARGTSSDRATLRVSRWDKELTVVRLLRWQAKGT